MLITYFVFVLISSLLISLAEIQIEGAFGWAKNLPTWRKKISIGKLNFEITGYHLFFFSSIFILMHFVFVFIPFTIQAELIIISAFMFMTIFEDFFWFLFNPNYGLKKYNKENVYWFKNWFLGFPSFYFIILPLATILLITALNI